LAPAAAALLREDGWNAVHVSEIGMGAAEDAAILDAASADDRVCITLDHDFHSHLAVARAGRPSVILLRVQGLDARGQASLIRSVWASCASAIEEGAAVSAGLTTVRVRRLPLR
jgi:predicted nuclease of predicted toxin-antitoxin system